MFRYSKTNQKYIGLRLEFNLMQIVNKIVYFSASFEQQNIAETHIQTRYQCFCSRKNFEMKMTTNGSKKKLIFHCDL